MYQVNAEAKPDQNICADTHRNGEAKTPSSKLVGA